MSLLFRKIFIYKVFALVGSRPLDAIMWTIVWRIVCSCLNSFSVQHADVQWITWIEETNTIEKYKRIVTLMLSDGIMNEGRLLVLNTFSLDVKQADPNMAEEVEEYKDLILSSY